MKGAALLRLSAGTYNRAYKSDRPSNKVPFEIHDPLSAEVVSVNFVLRSITLRRLRMNLNLT